MKIIIPNKNQNWFNNYVIVIFRNSFNMTIDLQNKAFDYMNLTALRRLLANLTR
jgi:hypothetical protein